MAKADADLRRAAAIFDRTRSEVEEGRAFIEELTGRFLAAGLIPDDIDAYRREKARALMERLRKLRLIGDEAMQAPLNLTETLPDGSRVNFFKAIEDMTPVECANFIHDHARVVRREQTKLARLHAMFKVMHGRKYTRQLRLNLDDFLPPAVANEV